jgi:hypothetical protein
MPVSQTLADQHRPPPHRTGGSARGMVKIERNHHPRRVGDLKLFEPKDNMPDYSGA